jgi:hypothetical protein
MNDIDTVKNKLINWISNLNDKKVLEQIDSFRKNQDSGFSRLSLEDQNAINEGLAQLNEGKYTSYSEARKQINSKLEKSD